MGNHRFVGLPTTIGVMVLALGGSLAFVVAGWTGFAPVIAMVRDSSAPSISTTRC
jgi:hypothetical protein